MKNLRRIYEEELEKLKIAAIKMNTKSSISGSKEVNYNRRSFVCLF
jgi:hypothetical protein